MTRDRAHLGYPTPLDAVIMVGPGRGPRRTPTTFSSRARARTQGTEPARGRPSPLVIVTAVGLVGAGLRECSELTPDGRCWSVWRIARV